MCRVLALARSTLDPIGAIAAHVGVSPLRCSDTWQGGASTAPLGALTVRLRAATMQDRIATSER